MATESEYRSTCQQIIREDGACYGINCYKCPFVGTGSMDCLNGGYCGEEQRSENDSVLASSARKWLSEHPLAQRAANTEDKVDMHNRAPGGMTAGRLALMLHYYTRCCDPEEDPYDGCVSWLLDAGLLRESIAEDDERTYAGTTKGEVYIKALLATPLPVQRWVVEEEK